MRLLSFFNSTPSPSSLLCKKEGNYLSLILLICIVTPLPALAKPPKLLVIVVVDQMRPDYFNDAGSFPQHGIRTLKEKSAFFTNAKINFVPTETAPGHAAIVTGLPPSQMGIVGNDWYEHKTKRRVNSDEITDGVISPENLLVETIGDKLKAKSPDSHVIAISFKDRAAVMLGGHKSDLTLWFSKKKRQFVSSPFYGPLPTWVAYLNKDLAPSIPIWPKFGLTLLTSQVDDYVFAAAKRAIQEYSLGKDDVPDLLLVSFSATDNIGHWYGPNSDKMKDQLIHLDRLLGEFLGEIEKASGNDFVLLLTSDHGVLPIPESPEGKKVWAKRIPKKNFISACEKAIEKIYPGGPWIVLTLIPDIYFDKAKIAENKISWDEFLSKAADQIRSVKDVAQVYVPPAFSEQDEYMSDYRRSYYPGRSGDLLIRMNAGVLVTRERSGTDHGSPYEYDAHIPLLFYGQNIQPKTYYDPVSIEDIFPTCLDTLELTAPFPTSDPPSHRSLREIFSSQSK